jgi:uncharacterized membrane protein YbaN (DUF454 family)
MTAEPPPQKPGPAKASPAALRPVYFVAGIILVGIGIAGYILPVLPGTIWMILAAACFARSSPKFEAWLINHPTFGPSVVAWRQNGAIPRKAKIFAIGMMAVSFVVLAFAHASMLVLAIVGLILLACALFVASRPIGPKTQT